MINFCLFGCSRVNEKLPILPNLRHASASVYLHVDSETGTQDQADSDHPS